MTVDVSRVPIYPVVRIELRDTGDEFVGLADGSTVQTGPDKGPVRDALISYAAGVAARRPGPVPAVRVVGAWGDEQYELVVTGAGEVLDAGPGPGARTTGQGGGRRKWLPLLLAAGVAVPGLGVGIVALSSPNSPQPVASSAAAKPSTTATAMPTQLPVEPPLGWSAVASWSTPIADLSSGLRPAVAGSVVVVPTGDGSVVSGVDGLTGAVRWSARAGEPVAAGVESSRIDGRPVVVASTSSALFAWDAQTGRQVGKWKVPAGASGVLATPTGLVVVGPGQHVQVATGKGLVPRVLPAGATVVGVSGANVLAVSDGRLWTVASDRVAGAPKALPAAPKGQAWRGVVGRTATGFVVAYGAADASTVGLRGLDFSGKQRWASQQIPSSAAGSSQSSPLWIAPTGAFGVYGTSLVDIRTGATRGLPADWSTSGVGAVAYGTTGAGSAWVDPGSGAVHASTEPGDGSVPVAALGDVNGLALISARDGEHTVLYAVPRANGGGQDG